MSMGFLTFAPVGIAVGCYVSALVLAWRLWRPSRKRGKTAQLAEKGQVSNVTPSAPASDCVNPHAKKAWENYGTILQRDGYARDSQGNRLRPDPNDPSYRFIQTYPQFIQDGFWEGKDAYYPCLNPWYLYHYPVHDCPKCGANEPWDEPLVGRTMAAQTYYDQELQQNIETYGVWRCAECDERTLFDTRTGQFAYKRGLFGIKRRANWMHGVGGWGDAAFETVMVVCLAIIFGSLLLRVVFSFLCP